MISDFGKRIEERQRQIVEGATKATKRVALAANQQVITGTPIDTGVGVSNWQASVGSPINTEIPAYVPGESMSTAAVNTQQALKQGIEAIKSVGVDEKVFLTNNIHYLIRLNNGSPNPLHVPAGFLQRAAATGAVAMKRIKLFGGD